jgi:hypothetical protein
MFNTILEIMGCCVRINKKVNDIFIDKNPKFENSLTIYSRHSYFEPKITWFASIPHHTFFVEEFKFSKERKRYRIWKAHQLFSATSEDEARLLCDKSIKRPWLWIGSDEGFDMTEYIEQYLVVGNVITLQVLKSIVNDIHDWQYMCPKTFEMKEFPIDGIQIEENDS